MYIGGWFFLAKSGALHWQAMAWSHPSHTSNLLFFLPWLLPLAFISPHIVHLMVDDYGFNNVGYHASSQANAKEVVTPTIDMLASTGVILDRFYAYRFCSPSRSSFLTGRNPIHVNTGNDALTLLNPKDPVSGFAGIPRNMTAIAEKLASVGYETVQAGCVSAAGRL